MKIEWDICNDKKINVLLDYNSYIFTKKLYINGDKILEQKGKKYSNMTEFYFESKKYILELEPQNYDYVGYLITPQGERIPSKRECIVKDKIPLWIIPFIVLNMAIPIISVEAFTPWIIGIAASYITAKVAGNKSFSKIKRVASCGIVLCAAWLIYFLYYLSIKGFGFLGGFIPFNF